MSEREDRFAQIDYRRLISWPKRLEREWRFLGPLFAAAPSTRLLDLGCAAGDHARFLAAKGFEVTGVDASPAMLASARAAGTPPGVAFIEGDLADVELLVEGSFGGAFCLGNTLPHLETDAVLRRFLRGLRTRLLPGAPFVVQLLNYHRVFDGGVRHLPPAVVPNERGELVFLRLMTPAPSGRVLFTPATLRYRPEADQPLVIETAWTTRVRGWLETDLLPALQECGFARAELFGGMDRGPFVASQSPDLIIVAQA